ncbi:MAG: indole-3-glycerol phosphate synthase TrpC [Bacillota bacterium]|nr:indole-3-glycerol phosphate synthase TrpC [Bacillota bacterium]
MILDTIAAKKAERLKNKPYSLDEIKAKCFPLSRTPLDFSSALKQDGRISLIGEVKKASPSKGLIRPDFDHLEIAHEYMNSDVQALSVLTEEDFFLGSPTFLSEIRKISFKPLLRKDFIIEPYQIYEAYLLGADAVLLITALLSDADLKEFYDIAVSLGLTPLIEVHDEMELEKALRVNPPLIGINNRNLKTFSVDLNTTARLKKLIPSSVTVVAESGILTSANLIYVKSTGADAALVGEAFMRYASVTEGVFAIRGGDHD